MTRSGDTRHAPLRTQADEKYPIEMQVEREVGSSGATDAERLDRELLERVLAGRPGAWNAFYDRFRALLLACIRRTLRRYVARHNEEDIEDLLSTTCLNLVRDGYHKLRAYDSSRGYKLSSWLALIATNTVHDALRKREQSAVSLDDSENHVAESLIDTGADPAEKLLGDERQKQLLRAIDGLDEIDREFLTLYYVDECEPEEIAQRMGIAINTVYSRKHKIREKLRHLVELSRDAVHE